MAVDSIKIVQHTENIHTPARSAGRLSKGHSITTTTASIPTKYQTIVEDNSEKKGFLSRSKRFNDDITDDMPGPGTYLAQISSAETISASFSKRGTSMFASKSRRVLSGLRDGPGPSRYVLPSTINSRTDFNQSHITGAFHLPIAHPLAKHTGPAPNQYNVCLGKRHVANVALKSREKRELIDKETRMKPSPCQYNVNDALLHERVKVPISSFVSTSGRVFPPKPAIGPSPTRYRPYDSHPTPPYKPLYPRHNYLCLSSPAMPLPPTPPPPGPGSYDIAGRYDNPMKAGSSSAAFVSRTGRWTGDVTDSNIPSPAHYKPIAIERKESFLYNSTSRWI